MSKRYFYVQYCGKVLGTCKESYYKVTKEDTVFITVK